LHPSLNRIADDKLSSEADRKKSLYFFLLFAIYRLNQNFKPVKNVGRLFFSKNKWNVAASGVGP
jgi:hypothetical protein